MIIEGCQPEKEPEDINKKLLAIKGDLEEEESRRLLSEFLRYNIGFTTKILTGINLEPIQRLVIKGWFAKNFIMSIASRGFSKCIDENAYILSNSGFKKIKDLKIGEKVFAEKDFQLVENKWENPEEDGFIIKTVNSFENIGKIGHKIKIFNPSSLEFEYKNIENIKLGDIIPIKYGMSQWFNQNPLDGFQWKRIQEHVTSENDIHIENNKDLYYFIGILLGDGNVGKIYEKYNDSGINITNEDSEIKDFCKYFINKYIPYAKIRSYTRKPENQNLESIRFNSSTFIRFLIHCGYKRDVNAPQKTIPEKLLLGNKENIAMLIRGLFDTDGYSSYQYNQKQNRYSCNISLSSSSYELITSVRRILLNFGILTSLQQKLKAGKSKICGVECNHGNSWDLRVMGYENIKKFNDIIGFGIKHKQDGINRYLQSKEVKNSHNFNLIPIGKYLYKKYGHAKLNFNNYDNISLEKIKSALDRNIFDDNDKNKLKELFNNYYFAPVKEITPTRTKTIDIQVANEHCYWSDGFINHNSTLAAVFAILHCIFNPKNKVLLVSATFRSSRSIIDKIEEWAKSKNGVLLKQTFAKEVVRRNDEYVVHFKNGSQIRAVPLGDANKLRGFRCNVLFIDEGLLIPENVIEMVLKPFLSASSDIEKNQKLAELENKLLEKGFITEEEKTKRKSTSKMIILSSASYQWESLYERYKKYLQEIYESERTGHIGEASYLVQQMSWETIPKTILDPAIEKEITSGQIPQSVIDREYRAIFTQNSDGYFSAKKMAECTIPDGQTPTIEIKGDPQAEYVLGIDPNMSASESSDHFAMCLLKIITNPKNDKKIGLVVHQYACAGVELKHHIEYFYYLLKNFNIVYIGCDTSQGDNLDFINICNESELFKAKNITLLPIEIDSTRESIEDLAKQVRNSYSIVAKRIVQKQYFHSAFQKAANEYMKACFDFGDLLFAGKALAVNDLVAKLQEINIGEIYKTHPEFSSGNIAGTMYDFIQNQDLLIDQTKKECALIEPSVSKLGSISYDLPSTVRRNKNPNRARKDSYSALFLANWVMKLYLESLSIPESVDEPFDFMLL